MSGAADEPGHEAGQEAGHEAQVHDTVEAVVRSQLAKALGGRRGMVEAAVPTLVFTILWLTTRELNLALGVSVAFALLYLKKIDVIELLARPVMPYMHGPLMVTHPSDLFDIVMNASITLGLILASPVLVWQVWGFLSPALYQHERKVVIPVAEGRNLAVLLEAAVRNHILQLRGIHTTREFIERQQQEMNKHGD